MIHSTAIIHEGKPVGLRGIALDITERKQMENALRESEERFRQAMEATSDGLWDWNVKTDEIYFSPAYARMLGYEPGYLSEHIESWKDRIHPDDRERAVRANEDCIENRIPRFEVEFRMRTKGDEWIWVLGRGRAASRDANGRALRMIGTHQDISERKRMEEELRASRERLEYVVKGNPALIYIAKPLQDLSDYYSTFHSISSVSMTGFESEKFLGEKGSAFWSSRVHPDDLASFKVRIAELWTSGHWIWEYRFLHKNGTYRWLMEEANVIRDHTGSVKEIIGYWIDVTERKRMEEELRSTKERLEYLIQSNPAVIYSGKPLADLSDWELTFVSDRVTSMVGYAPEELIGHREFWHSHVHPDDQHRIRSILPDLWKKGRLEIEYRFLCKDGNYRWIREKSIGLRDADDKPIAVHGYTSDITEQKQAEQALRESEVRYRRLFQNSPTSLLEEDFSAVKKYLDALRGGGVRDFRTYFTEHPEDVAKCSGLVKILDVNQATLTLYKAQSVEDFVGGLSKVLTKESLDMFREEIVALAEDKTRFESESVNQTLAGDTKYASMIVSVVPGYEDTLGKVLVSVVDLTEYKLMEARLLRSERLVAIGETAAMVGHDLRNPLQGMTGTLYLAKSLSGSDRVEDRKEVAELLDTIDHQIVYMDKIVSDLQSYAGPVEAEPAETNLHALVREVISNVHVPGNIEIHTEVQEDLSSVMVDRILLQRVLVNLITNAVQAMPEGGNLTVTANEEKESLTMTVEDTGEGIARENMNKIFNPFFTTKAKGQGLGLAVCKRLVEAQGGTITVKSEYGNGSTFSVRIPTSRGQER
jgi:PAS domain S-box-containing protein